MRRLVVLEHVPFEGLGRIEPWARQREFSISRVRLFQNDPFPEFGTFDFLVIMGGPMNVYEENRFPWLRQEKEFLGAARQQTKKILGVCLGAQLIANMLGARISRNPCLEIGWHPVTLTEEGKHHPWFLGFDSPFQALHWHGDTFEIPKGAVRLAESRACRNQAFAYGDQILGLQFHLDYGFGELQEMIRQSPEDLKQTGDTVQSKECLLSLKDFFPKTESNLNRLLDQFVLGQTQGGLS